MTKIDIISGFLGAGKTTLIKKLLKDGLNKEKIVLIENEFGEIGIDKGFLKEAGVEIKEMNSGCICCSLVGDFSSALAQVIQQFNPQRIIIEPSGVGKLSDVIAAVVGVSNEVELELNSFTTVADGTKMKMYQKNFGEFYNDQIQNANTVILSRTQKLNETQLKECVEIVHQTNPEAVVITTPWDDITGTQMFEAMVQKKFLLQLLQKQEEECECGHHHEHEEECECGHHHEHEEGCECGHHHKHEEECECGHHHEHEEECECGHHHEHDEECGCGHHHEHEEECGCGHHHEHHHHHHGHGADEVFTSWGVQTVHVYSELELRNILASLDNQTQFGMILRAKGIVQGADGSWFHFDYVPEELEIRKGEAAVAGMICVIGSDLKESQLVELFQSSKEGRN